MDTLEAYYGPNAGYVLELYERFLRDPASVDPDSRQMFAQWNGTGSALLQGNGPPPAAATGIEAGRAARVAEFARAVRTRGHLTATLDPLGGPPPGEPDLDTAAGRINARDLRELPASVVDGPVGERARTAGEAIDQLRRIYCGTVGYDYGHIEVAEERAWLQEAVESERYLQPLSHEVQRQLLDRLTEVEAFEQYLQRAFPGQKRFSIEGTDMLVPMLDAVITLAALDGTRHIVVGMAHRGRLNVLTHVLGKPYSRVFGEFQHRSQTAAPSEHFAHHGWTGDVKYHLGARRTLHEDGVVRAHITLAPNPSHLEFINPVILGMTRALQEDRHRPGEPLQDTSAALALLIHGDAAFPGEGVVAESLNISQLAGYRIGGAVHIITNNQLGFTTDPRDARSTLYASDLAKGFEIPIVHVNADDAAACLGVAQLAYAYRRRFHKDFLIDLVGYRRWGHNEADEPAFTQPLLYEKVRSHPTVRALWAERMAAAAVITVPEATAELEAAITRLQQVPHEDDQAQPEERGDRLPVIEPITTVAEDRLERFNQELLEWPAGFTAHPKLERLLRSRQEALHTPGGIEWSHAEALALGSLLAEGTPIRMIGQDTERGTFSQRHLVLHDIHTGATYTPLRHLREAAASFAIFNSPLSESAALGFEYGFGNVAGDTLVLWEAQFGDFANAAQVIIDQFISSARAKWREHPWLVLLLPHGYEGQGPEHSSGRLERFLQLAGEDNLRIANCTTAAQYFHLLRRQVALRTADPRPLILMTPKSLLREKLATSSLVDLTAGAFRPVLDDPHTGGHRDLVTRVILCTGKVYVDLIKAPARADADRVALVRLEQLYPFPSAELARVLAGYTQMREVIWLQEEPRNMGAWHAIAPRLQELVGREQTIQYIGRPDRASPAEGSQILHTAAHARIISEAFSTLQGSAALVRGVEQHAV